MKAPSQKIQMLTPAHEAELIEQWLATKDQKLLLQLIQSFEPLVLKFVRQFSSYGVPREELVAVGNLALVEVANRFEPERGLKFSTFASHWVRGTMLVYIANNYFTFSMKSQRMKKIFFHLRSLVQDEQKKNNDESVHEILGRMAKDFGIESYRLEQIFNMIRQPNISIDEPISSSKASNPGEIVTLGDTLMAEGPTPEEAVIDKSAENYRHDLIHGTMMRVLNERERTILTGQMLADDTNERTLQDLAEQFGLSRERVRQIRNIAFAKLERAIRRKCAHTDPRIFMNVSGRKRKDMIPVIQEIDVPENTADIAFSNAAMEFLIDWTQLAA